MKLAHRIVTPVIAIGAVVMGLLLKLFSFTLGGTSEEIDSIVSALPALFEMFGGDLSLTFEYSVFEIISLLVSDGSSTGISPESINAFMAIAEPIKTELVFFLSFFIISLVLFVAVAVVSAMGKRKATIITSAAGLVCLFVSIVASRFAFDVLTAGEEIALADLVPIVSDSEWTALIQLAATFVAVKTATLSYGFYGIFGMFILIIFWTILSNMLIRTPIHFKKKHRKKPTLKRPSAIFKK